MRPGIGKRLSRDEHRRVLWKHWTVLTTAADEYTVRQTEALFEALKQAVTGQITQTAAQYAKLGVHDEHAYEHCARLMDAYRETVSVYERYRNEINALPVKGILEGIHSVLTSRLKSFEDADTNNGNPVTQEKQALCDRAAGYFAASVEGQARLFKEHRLPGVIPLFRHVLLQPYTLNKGAVLAALEHMQESARTFCFRGLYAFYKDGIKFCLAHLNDLSQREKALYYFELLDSEWEVLSNIIKIQVNALERAVERPNVNARDKLAVYQVLTLIREAYQHTGRAVTDNHHILDNEPVSTIPTFSFEEFEKILLDICEDHKRSAVNEAQAMLVTTDESKTAFQMALDKETDALFEQIKLAFLKAAYRFQRIVSEEILMADEMTDMFEKARAALPTFSNRPDSQLVEQPADQPAQPASEEPAEPPVIHQTEAPQATKAEREIILGIAESLDIKIESMKESIYAFNEDSLHLINDFAAGKKDVANDDLLGMYNLVLEKWADEMVNAEPKQMAAFFDRCADMELIAFYKQYYDKREDEYAKRINKSVLGFKKETLLYEVSTYEEILTYSVSRLRDAEWDTIRQTAVMLDGTLKMLEMLLKKNNIQVIRPVPHEAFNGREHEVLMAEKQDGFSKGEIIKSMNSGYKQKDVIILRANVIAAR